MSKNFFTYNFKKILNAIESNPFNKSVSDEFEPIVTGVVDTSGDAVTMGFVNKQFLNDYWGNSYMDQSEPCWGLNMDISRGYYIALFNGENENDETSYEVSGTKVFDLTSCTSTNVYNNNNSIIRLLCNVINVSSDTSFNRIGIYKRIAKNNNAYNVSSTFTYALVGVIELDNLVPFNVGDNYAITIQLTREISNV